MESLKISNSVMAAEIMTLRTELERLKSTQNNSNNTNNRYNNSNNSSSSTNLSSTDSFVEKGKTPDNKQDCNTTDVVL